MPCLILTALDSIMSLDMDKALSVVEASRLLGCSRVSLLRPWWRKRHALPAIRVGRRVVFFESDLRAWLDARREPWGRRSVEPFRDHEDSTAVG